MIAAAVVLQILVFFACIGGSLWREYHDNFGERVGMVVVGGVCVARSVLMVDGRMTADLSDVLLAGGVCAFAWGMLCAKRRSVRRKMQYAKA